MAVAETCLWHASDWIAWIDRSGDARPDVQRLVDAPLAIRFTGRPPRDLRVIQKPGRTLLWRNRPDALRRTARGEVAPEDRRRPAVPAYALEGEVDDPHGRYLPRRFALQVGGAGGVSVPVYRAPAGVSYRSAGGLEGRAVFGDGTPAAWAVLELTVTPPLAGAQPYVTQADGNGEFRFALDRLPALTKDAPAREYPASLAVRASLAAAREWRATGRLADPDALPAATVRNLSDLAIAPGRVACLTSRGSPDLELETVPPGP